MTIEQHISSQIHYPLYAKTVINTIAAKEKLAIWMILPDSKSS